ncbi:hypothetical protein M569_05056 [Genlisea aurea]|uniref:Uncharacterized protein n=1 Tax=Genlisea aurea TaxID=192259 RepID=S8CR45_9LAMI|nr:hypothetical protein M569_05056 [Genlisea aurea]
MKDVTTNKGFMKKDPSILPLSKDEAYCVTGNDRVMSHPDESYSQLITAYDASNHPFLMTVHGVQAGDKVELYKTDVRDESRRRCFRIRCIKVERETKTSARENLAFVKVLTKENTKANSGILRLGEHEVYAITDEYQVLNCPDAPYTKMIKVYDPSDQAFLMMLTNEPVPENPKGGFIITRGWDSFVVLNNLMVGDAIEVYRARMKDESGRVCVRIRHFKVEPK